MRAFFDSRYLSDVLDERTDNLNSEIDGLNSDELLANDNDILLNNFYEKFHIDPLMIYKEDVSKRSLKLEKINIELSGVMAALHGTKTTITDGYRIKLYVPFEGDTKLFYLQPSRSYIGGVSEKLIKDNHLIFEYEVEESKLKDEKDLDRFLASFNSELNQIKMAAGWVNDDLNIFNLDLKDVILNRLKKRRLMIGKFHTLSKIFEVPLEKTNEIKKSIPIVKKILPIAQKYNAQDYWAIADAHYTDILGLIKNSCSTFERTPNSYKSLDEEQLRDIILSMLNGVYKNATGEAFRNKGKTDICIEHNNRAAFVAECKNWKGVGSIDADTTQLDGYLTWRDFKTSLIYFVKAKNFTAILEKVEEHLKLSQLFFKYTVKDRNEFECHFASKSNEGQSVVMRLFLFNLYIE